MKSQVESDVNKLFKEYLKEEDENPANIIMSVAELVRKDADSEDEVAKTSIPYFLMLLKNAGLPISYAGLKSYYNAHPELKNVIQTFNDSEIVFVGQGDEKDGESLGEPQGEVPPEEVVDKMAKRAMKKREESVVKEGTWALPDTPELKADLKKLMMNKIPLGKDGETAMDIIGKYIGDDELYDDLYTASKKNGSKGDARPIISGWMDRNFEGSWEKYRLVGIGRRHSHMESIIDEDEYAALDSFTNSVDLTPEEEAKIAAGPDAYEADEKLMAKLMDHFSDGMPYGTQKGRTGDPYEFIFQELDLMGLIKEDVYGGSPAPINTIDKVQSITDNGSAMKIDGVMVDTFNASLIMDIYNKVNEKNQDKMRSMPVEKLASSAYKLANRFKEDVDEGYYEMPPMDRDRYTDLPGLEGPFQTRSGKVVYYDPKEGKYYDRDSDMYLSYDEFKDYDQSRPEDFKMTVKMPKAMQKEDKFDYWQSPSSLAKLAGIKERKKSKKPDLDDFGPDGPFGKTNKDPLDQPNKGYIDDPKGHGQGNIRPGGKRRPGYEPPKPKKPKVKGYDIQVCEYQKYKVTL